MIWNEHVECMDRASLVELQNSRLHEMISRLYYNVPFYRKKFQEQGIEPNDIQSIEQLKTLPLTTKQDLRDNYPFGLFAVSQREIIRLHASSGTTGKPTVGGYTRRDVEIWSEVVARSLYAAGVDHNDIVHVSYGYGLFTGGLGIHQGAQKIGATVIPASGGNTKKQLQIMHDFGSTVLACTPSYALYLADTMKEISMNPEELKLRRGIFGAEPWSEEMRKEIEKKLHLKALDIYGLTEIIGPGVAMECEHQQGLHVFEDHFIPEIIDPVTLQTVAEGKIGELVITTLTKEGMPLLRYRTRDLTSMTTEKCSCGRTSARIHKLMGRTDDMLIIRGVNVFPSQIESVLLEMSETEPHYQLIVDRINNLDVLEILVEVNESFFSDGIRQLEALSHKMKAAIESTLGISAKIRLVEPRTIERTEGKSKHVIDKRRL
ncbi:MAG: phenylacetate--CoA ligase family protein [Microbacter sp.]